jgi:dihydroxyacetone kinase-like protein
MSMSGADATAVRMILAAAQAVAAAQEQLNALDSTVGDGDHGVNFASALTAAATHVQAADELSAAQVFAAVAETLNNEMGGAAGVIFGAFFGGVGEALTAVEQMDAAVYALMLASGLTEVQRLGKAVVGDKTVVDALAPAAQAAQDCAQAGDDLAVCAQQAAAAAADGAAATAALEARKGRARFLGARSIGQADAGATSLALVLGAWAQVLSE